jgi:hypothetical protein
VVQVSGGALARTSSVAPPTKIKSKLRVNRVDTIFRAGLTPCSFFREALLSEQILKRGPFEAQLFELLFASESLFEVRVFLNRTPFCVM